MKIPHSSTLRSNAKASMTPMIDVVFLLLIFFICTANFQLPESVLPSPLAGVAVNELPTELIEPKLERILVGVTQRGEQLELTVNKQPCPSTTRLSELLAALAQIDRTLPVLLDIHDDTPLGTAIDIYDRCRLARFEQIQFVAEVR